LFQPVVLLAEHIDLLLQRSPLLMKDKWDQGTVTCHVLWECERPFYLYETKCYTRLFRRQAQLNHIALL